MAENERVQLKREEVVGNEVVLSDIAPITNTESVDDSAKGIKLAQTLDKIWNDINNKLSRVVNSVNGRTGVVVLDSSDVGLENVDNVSFDDIKKWVITRIKQEFDNHILQLFDTLEEADQFAASHDESFHGTPFFSTHGRASENELRSVIGYFYWDMGSGRLTYESRTINTVGGTDNSIIYNEYVNGHDFTGGRIGVNIYKYEDALKLYNATSGEPATQSSLEESGLYIDKDILAHEVFVFDGCYSPTSFNTFLAKQAPALNPRIINIWIDGSRINLGGNFYLDSSLHIKKYDIIICNFADLPEYHESDGSIKDGIYPELITGQPAIGQIVSAPDRNHPTTQYAVRFFTLRPKVDFGLTYFHQDGTGNENSEYGDTLDHAHPSILGVKPTTGYVEGVSSGNEVINVSGLTVSGIHGKADNESDHEANNREYSTVFPHGARSVYTAMDKSVSGSLGGVSVVPDMSMCVIPNGYDETHNLKNLPIKRAGDVDDKTGNATNVSNLGINLLKWIRPVSGSEVNETNAINLSGLKIIGSSDTVQVLDPTDNTQTIDLTGDDHSGGLAVNVGEFLKIDYPSDGTAPSKAGYYNSGKVIVNVNKMYGLDDVGGGKLGIKLGGKGIYSSNANTGGLKFDHRGYLSIYAGAGIAIGEQYNQYGQSTSGNPYSCIAALTIDPQTTPKDLYDDLSSIPRFLGGLRYLAGIGKSFTALGVRVNEVTAWDPSDPENVTAPPRIGSEGLRISDDNVLGVQPYKTRHDQEANPVSVKYYSERDLLMMLDPPFQGLIEEYLYNDPNIQLPSNPSEDRIYNYRNEYYIYDIASNSCRRAFVYLNSNNGEDFPSSNVPNRVMYVRAAFDTTDTTPQNISEIIPGSNIIAKAWVDKDGTYFPDFTTPGMITYTPTPNPSGRGIYFDSPDAQAILDAYHLSHSTQTIYDIYLDKINNKIYADADHQTEVYPIDGRVYRDLTTRPSVIYIYTDATHTFDYTQDAQGNDRDETWYKRADCNYDTLIDSSDAAWVFTFCRLSYNGQYENNINGWVLYLQNEHNIPADQEYHGFKELLNVNSSNKEYIPGVNLDYNRYQGLKVDTTPDGAILTNKRPLSINIVDPSNGYYDRDIYGNGGLRFGANGVLAIRLNENTDYDSFDPNKRHTNENGGYSHMGTDTYYGVDKDELTEGTRGLKIYPSNVLGIKVNTTRGDLMFDVNGNLVISDEWAPGGKTLTIGNVEYDGTENVTIQIGPGLKLE